MSPDSPIWLDWELELTPHLLKRMVDRGFSETDLREMLADARGVRPGSRIGRFSVETTHSGSSWEVVVEPDMIEKLLVVVTAYPVN